LGAGTTKKDYYEKTHDNHLSDSLWPRFVSTNGRICEGQGSKGKREGEEW
jgi:hypothetical protein